MLPVTLLLGLLLIFAVAAACDGDGAQSPERAECEDAGGIWHDHTFTPRDSECHLDKSTGAPTGKAVCEEAGGTWHDHTFTPRDPECHLADEPEPTEPTPTQGLPESTAAECAYLETLVGQSEDLGDALGRIGELASNPQFFSDEWILDMALQMVIIQITYDEASALDPPGSLQQVHDAYLGGLSRFNGATTLFTEGIDNLDPEPILEASDLMLQGSEDIGRATELIGEFVATRSGSC